MNSAIKALGALIAALALAITPAQASFTFLNASSATTTEFSFDGSSAPAGTGNCASTTECVGDVPMDKSGTPLFTSSNAGLVAGLGTAGSPSGGVVSIQGVTSGQAVPVSGTFWQSTQPVSLASLPALTAGSAIAGKFGIDQTTVGTTNGVSLAQIGANTVSTGTGAVGTGSQRIAVGTDTATIAGSAPSTVLQSNNAQWGGNAITGTVNAVGTAGAGNVPTINAYIVGGTNANGAAAASSSSPVTNANRPPGAAVFAATQVSCANTATSVVSARTGVSGTGRISETITNTTTTAIYVGGSGVTTSTGQLLPGIVGSSLTVNTTAALYCIVATGTATVTSLETY